jgi:hypothetical protein
MVRRARVYWDFSKLVVPDRGTLVLIATRPATGWRGRRDALATQTEDGYHWY